ncbi:enoyl-CoA hydratase [Peribacillus simplex]|uniref:Enoyl-CoA hydratase n=1 Tax=Peribacillus simplex TaxID=1478 RepID=A0AAW7IUE9_9BACI|nr:enoyl-CoA hydratase [Peribacillus simplex]AMM93001.1 enoyl-CoA hydratase [Peribacillus simplex]MDM5294836.1 enoyl-CoA hydratase [Peribacillus simplex]MDM5453792.1 enoyl-CoA hydratase [Peribacillus simplex]
MTSLVEISHDAKGIAIVTLNRPDAANALSTELLHCLFEGLDELKRESNLRTVILTGAGEKAFCAGADLKERAGMNDDKVKETVKLIGDTITAVENLPVPVIAAINGPAFGGGLELALACDIRIASETAKMGLTETALGIIPGAGGTQRLPRIVGMSTAKELIYTAKRLDAKAALAMKIISHVYPPQQLLEEAKKLAGEIAVNAPLALRAAKAAINQGADTNLKTGLQIEKDCYQTTLKTRDRLEGLSAFKEKRKPVFTGR